MIEFESSCCLNWKTLLLLCCLHWQVALWLFFYLLAWEPDSHIGCPLKQLHVKVELKKNTKTNDTQNR